MPIFRLRPLDPDSPLWQRSRYRGPAVLRAADVATARQLASHCFVGDEAATNPRREDPWQSLVTFEICTDSGYPEEGPAALLFPSWYTR